MRNRSEKTVRPATRDGTRTERAKRRTRNLKQRRQLIAAQKGK